MSTGGRSFTWRLVRPRWISRVPIFVTAPIGIATSLRPRMCPCWRSTWVTWRPPGSTTSPDLACMFDVVYVEHRWTWLNKTRKPSVDVRWRPLLWVVIVTHLVTRTLASQASLGDITYQRARTLLRTSKDNPTGGLNDQPRPRPARQPRRRSADFRLVVAVFSADSGGYEHHRVQHRADQHGWLRKLVPDHDISVQPQRRAR